MTLRLIRWIGLIAALISTPAYAVVTDSFTGTDGTDLSTYSANWGPLWSSAVGECKIYGNGVNSGGAFAGASRWDGRTWANDQYSQIKFITIPPATAGWMHAVVRGATDGSTRTGYVGGVDPENLGHLRYTIAKWVSNVRTTLVTHGSQEAAANDVVKLQVVGTTLTLYVNGSEILSTTDSAIASGDAGLSVLGLSGTVTYADDWEGDDVASGGGTPGFFRRRVQ